MLSHSHFNEGTELGLLLVNIYNETHTKVDSSSLEPLIQIFGLYNKADAGRESFMKGCLKWSISEGANKLGEPMLHRLMAEAYAKEKEYGKASKHFIRSNDVGRFSEVLSDWSKEVYASERDLVIARAVLQLLAAGNLKDANIVYKSFLNLNSNFPQTPLMNYLRYLLMTMERDAYPLFDVLRKKYEPSLCRDPSFDQFLDQIAQVFFNVRPQTPGMGNLFGDLMRSLLSPSEQQNQ